MEERKKCTKDHYLVDRIRFLSYGAFFHFISHCVENETSDLQYRARCIINSPCAYCYVGIIMKFDDFRAISKSTTAFD